MARFTMLASTEDRELVDSLAQDLGVTGSAAVRKALRLYRLVLDRQAAGDVVVLRNETTKETTQLVII